MTKTIIPNLQSLPGSDIWYCEAGEQHLYLGIIEVKKGHYRFVQAVAAGVDDAAFEFSKSGTLVHMARLSEVLEELKETE
jgi:hypothetical protein